MYRSILVPLDGSPFAERALPAALSLARRSSGRVDLVLVHCAFLYVETVDSGLICDDWVDQQLRVQEQSYLKSVVQRLSAATTVPVTSTVRDGLVADLICEEATAKSSDLIVMTTHGRGPLSRFWLGSVADALVRRASVPILLMRPQETEAALAQEPAFHHVLIPLDGSALAEQVLARAAGLGQQLNADLILLRVVKPVLYAGHDPTALSEPAVGQPITGEQQAAAGTYLEKVAMLLRAPSFQVETRTVLSKQPALAILEEALQQPGTIIALATHGRGGLTRALLGSVADKVIRGATGSVLVYRPSRQ